MNPLGKARVSEVTAHFRADVESVWNLVTNLQNYTWRSDIKRIDVLNDGNKFVEYAPNGNATTFTITAKEPYKEYALSMEHNLFTGSWYGHFSKSESGGTTITFVEQIHIHNPIIKLLSYALMNLKKMQLAYISDLKKALGES